MEDLPAASFPKRNLFLILSTDKGLCGGVNSILTRMTRQLISRLQAEDKQFQIVIVGEKGRAQVRRLYTEEVIGTLTDRISPYNFDLACSIAQETLSAEYDAIHVIYNEFRSAIAYVPSIKTIVPLIDHNHPQLYETEVEPEKDGETLQNFFEYTLATQVFHSLMENATSEQSSRMNAMENASKNATEMIGKLTLQYNRARQARITTELIEIISGASALKG